MSLTILNCDQRSTFLHSYKRSTRLLNEITKKLKFRKLIVINSKSALWDAEKNNYLQKCGQNRWKTIITHTGESCTLKDLKFLNIFRINW